MKVGYSFWGFLGDVKVGNEGELLSTPDGNAFYSWSIIKAFQDAGDKVYHIMPDRDFSGYSRGHNLFDSWCKDEREKAYLFTKDEKACPIGMDYHELTEFDLFKLWNDTKLYELGFILHEWRMLIPGRNDDASRGLLKEQWQPDLFIQQCLLKYCNTYGIKLVVFDLDYKLTKEDVENYSIKYIIELGNKWKDYPFVRTKKVFIPFDFNCIKELPIKLYPTRTLIYVGNRYERDWCIDKYIPEDLTRCIIHGNWKEGGRDSEQRWEGLEFGKRLQTSEMYGAYSDSVATILLAKKDYCDNEFMTARITEAIFYGTVPLFIEEYGQGAIMEYAGKYANLLTVRSKEEVHSVIEKLSDDIQLRKDVIEYLREHLRFMDCKFFASDLKCLVK